VTTLLFCQHGWSDTHRTMERLGHAVASPQCQVVATELGYIETWLGIERLTDTVERDSAAWLMRYPDATARVIGHSMGALIWLEVLGHHADWWPRFDRLVFLGAPIAGADIASLALPLGLTVAGDLALDRRALADRIASTIPTISIVGDLLPGTDGLVTHQSARISGARFMAVPGVTHMALRTNTVVQRLIRAFFRNPVPSLIEIDVIARHLRDINGLEGSDPRLARLAPTVILFADGSSVRCLTGIPGVGHLFLVSPEGQCMFAGRVGSRADIEKVLKELRDAYATELA
jgi:pimeloyl-ACP methyl ester carboxylesterase